MSTFSVYLNEPDDAVWETIREAWPGRHFILDERMEFIAPEGLALTSDIAKRVGMDVETGNGIHGIVAELGSYYGLNRIDLWEWLRKINS